MATPSQAQEKRFYCGELNGTPTTYVKTSSESIPIVQWLTNEFDGERTPEELCAYGSEQFQAAYEADENYLTIGRANGYDIICSASVAGGSCQRQLLTIPKNADPTAALNVLNLIIKGQSSAVLLQ